MYDVFRYANHISVYVQVGTLGEGVASTGNEAFQGVSGAVGSAGGALQSGIAGKGAEEQGKGDLGAKASETAGTVQSKTAETVGEVGGKAGSAADDAQKSLGMKDE